MDDSRLRSIIRSLQLRNVHNMPTHTRRRDKTSLPERSLQRLSIDSSLLLLLPSPMYSRYSRTVECPIQIRRHHFTVVVQLARYRSALCPWDAGVGNEDVETAVELADCGLNGGGYGVVGCYVDLVCFGCFVAPRSQFIVWVMYALQSKWGASSGPLVY